MLEATTYTRIYGQQQLGKYWCVFYVKLYSRKIFSYVFCKHFYNEKKERITVHTGHVIGPFYTHVHTQN